MRISMIRSLLVQVMKKQLLYVFLIILFNFFSLLGQLPNQSYTSAEVGEIISPQLSIKHLNQPSVVNGYAVLAGNAAHEIWDISDPYNPVFQTEFTSIHANGEAESHQVSYHKTKDGKTYLGTVSGKGIDIWDLTDPINVVYLSAMELPGINYGDVSNAIWGICWQGDYIYLGATNNGIYIVDASDKSNPVLVNTIGTDQIGNIFAGPLFALGNLLVVTTPKGHAGIATLDISDSENPFLLDSWTSSDNSYIGGFYGNHATLIGPYRVFDVTTDPTNISLVHSQTIPSSEYVSFDGGHLFLGGLRGGTQGIYKYDISDVSNPTLIRRIEGRDDRWDDQFSCAIGNLLIMADDQNVNGYVGAVLAVHEQNADLNPPEVMYVNPPDLSTDQPITSKIGLSMSDWIDLESVDITSFVVRPVGGQPISGKWGWTYTTLNFEPDELLIPYTTYEVVIPQNGITDLVGNNLQNDFITSFTTGSTVNNNGDPSIGPIQPIEVSDQSNWFMVNPDPNLIYEWETGDGNTVQGTSANYQYSEPGRYPVTLNIYEPANAQSVYEAEGAILSGGVAHATNHFGYSGTGFADYPSSMGESVYVEWNINRNTSSIETLYFSYALSNGSRPLNLSVNGGNDILIDFTGLGAWDNYTEVAIPNITLNAGSNTIRLSATAGSAGPNIDYLRVEPEVTSAPPVLVSAISFTQIVYNTITSYPSIESTAIIKSDESICVVNQDANTVTFVDYLNFNKLAETQVGIKPVSLCSVNGEIWVVNKESHNISIIDKSTFSVIQTLDLPYASQPTAIIAEPVLNKVYITLEASGEVIEINTASKTITNELLIPELSDQVKPALGAMVLNSTREFLYITQLISADEIAMVYKINTATFSVDKVITLSESLGVDESKFARGIPNYLTGISISPDGKQAWVASKKDNINRGLIKDGQPLQHDNTVRAITSLINLDTDIEALNDRVDIDNSDRCHSVTFSTLGDVAFIAMPGNKEVFVIDTESKQEIARLPCEDVPTHVYYDDGIKRLFCLNFMHRSLTVFDVSGIIYGGSTYNKLSTISTVANELLTSDVFHGKKIFYDATSLKLNEDGYMSCASCHLDGGHDGQVWDISNLGEGLRNTIDLRGKSGTGHGKLHWTGNFDEVHDFEIQIRELNNGTGLMTDIDFYSGTTQEALGDPKTGKSPDLDALAAYVESLDHFPESPYKNSDGSLTNEAMLGRDIFVQLECFNCHSGNEYTNSNANYFYDVGTIKNSSGTRLGSSLLGLDVPTLKGLWYTAPYLHDGSAKNLKEVLTTHNPDGKHTDLTTLSDTDLDHLIAFLKQIDDATPNAPESNIALTIDYPSEGDQIEENIQLPINISFSLDNLNKVEYYIDDTLVDITTENDFNGLWNNTQVGIHEIYVKAYYESGMAVVSDCLQFEVLPASPCPVEGTLCDDNDSCTTFDIYDANCNCIGIFADEDFDGVCDVEDQYPGFVDSLVGRVNVRICLEGFLEPNSNLMSTQLRTTEIIEPVQPYNAEPYFYSGSEAVIAPSSFDSNVVDWVLIELRTSNDLEAVVERKAALLHANGVIHDIDGSPGVSFSANPHDTYHLAVFHKSHLGVVSAQEIDLLTFDQIDFTNSSNVVLGVDQLKQLQGTIEFALYCGDFDGNGIINNIDYNLWSSNNSAVNQYLSHDGDGNGIVNNLDYNLWLKNRSKVGELSIQF